MTVDCERSLAHSERNLETTVKNFASDTSHNSSFTRRRFIQAAGAAAALSRSGWAARPSASNRITIGVIGWGMMGPANTKAFLTMDDCQVVAACDIDTLHLQTAVDTINTKYGNTDCKAYHDYRELLARDDIDAVMIAIPDQWHAIVATEAANRKKDIYGEKPLARTVAEQQAIVKAVEKNGIIWQTGSWQRSVPQFHKAAELVRKRNLLILGVALGIPMGVASAYWHEKWPDHVIRVVSLVGYSVPVFWLSLVALFVFYYKLGWVAGPGQLDVFYNGVVNHVTGLILVDSLTQGQLDVFWNAVGHMTLPAILLGYYSLAYIARMTRSVMLDELSREYILAARLKGASELRVVANHGLRNAAIPLVTIIALSYGGLLEGSVLVETIFSWPGIGNYIYQSLFAADMNAVLGGTLLVGCVYVLINTLSDVLYRTLDPRSRGAAA